MRYVQISIPNVYKNIQNFNFSLFKSFSFVRKFILQDKLEEKERERDTGKSFVKCKIKNNDTSRLIRIIKLIRFQKRLIKQFRTTFLID